MFYRCEHYMSISHMALIVVIVHNEFVAMNQKSTCSRNGLIYEYI